MNLITRRNVKARVLRAVGAIVLVLGAVSVVGDPRAAWAAPPDVVPAAVTAAQPTDGPSDRQMTDLFRDRWGDLAFKPTRIENWQPVARWDRAAQYSFAPGTDEFTAEPTQAAGLKPLRLVTFSRDNDKRHRTEFQVTEEVQEPDGTMTFNHFPVFRGTPRDMIFSNSVGVHGAPSEEIQEHCRDHTKGERVFQLCRVLFPDRGIAYHVKVQAGSPTTGLPTVRELLNAFRDQWGRVLFRASGVTGWQRQSTWRRLRLITFPEGKHELNSTPQPFTGKLKPFDRHMYERTLRGKRELQVLHTFPPGIPVTIGPFPFDRFSGTFDDHTYYTTPTEGVPVPGEYQFHVRTITVNGEQFLVQRTIRPSRTINYYVLRRVT